MKIACPQCGRIIPPEQANIQTDLALCADCNETFRISQCLDLEAVDEQTLREPPSGAWFREEFQGFVLGASTRSPIAFFLVPFTCVWAGGSMWGLYIRQIIEGEFDLASTLFGLPFLVGSIFLCSFTLMMIFGKVVVSVEGQGGEVFTGLGPMGWRRPFNWAEVESIGEELSSTSSNNSSSHVIVLKGPKELKFGSMLNDKRRCFMLNMLKLLKLHRR